MESIRERIEKALQQSDAVPISLESWLLECLECDSSTSRLAELEQDSMIENKKLLALSEKLIHYDGRIYGTFSKGKRSIGDIAESSDKCKTRYRSTIRIDGNQASSHRLIFFQSNNLPVLMPPVVDHIDGQRKAQPYPG